MEGVEVIRARVFDEDRFITAGEVISGLDAAFWIVKWYYGPLLAQAVEERLE